MIFFDSSRRCLPALSASLTLVLTSFAWAQPETPPTTPPPGEVATRPAALPVDLVTAMTTKLNLDEAQQAQAKKIFDENRTKVTELRKNIGLGPQFSNRMKELMQSMREAREANDMDRIRLVSDEVREMRKKQEEQLQPLRRQIQDSQDELHQQLAAILRPDQQAGFEEIWQQRMSRTQWGNAQRRSPQALKAAVEKVSDLSDDQKQKIDQLFKTFHEASRSREDKGDTQAAAQAGRLESRLFDDVLTQLTAPQRGVVMSELQGRMQPRRPTTSQPQEPAGQPAQP